MCIRDSPHCVCSDAASGEFLCPFSRNHLVADIKKRPPIGKDVRKIVYIANRPSSLRDSPVSAKRLTIFDGFSYAVSRAVCITFHFFSMVQDVYKRQVDEFVDIGELVDAAKVYITLYMDLLGFYRV